MSHIAKIELEINDLEALKEACRNLGFEFKENQKTYAWYGTWVGRFEMPEGITEEQLGKCDHAIAIPDCTYEVGIVQRGNKYLLLWDSWRTGGLVKRLGKNAGILKQGYTVARIEREAKRKGYRVTHRKMAVGVQLVLSS